MPIEPFDNQTFRCPRCGSGFGPGCDCWIREKEDKKKEDINFNIPKIEPIIWNIRKPWEDYD